LTSIVSAPSADSALNFVYHYNDANQRTRVTLADGSYWIYQYDKLGQVTAGKKYWSDGTVVAGQQFGYGYDDIGNRTTTEAGGNEWGANLRYASYGANSLNQYTNRTVSGSADVTGAATNTATVSVWTTSAGAIPAQAGDPPGYFRTSRGGEVKLQKLGTDPFKINYIGIGLYEAWLCDSLSQAKAIVWLWKVGKWHDVPSAGTMHWLEVGYNKYQTLKSADDSCCRCPWDDLNTLRSLR
jgi:YD repeat-containing protein